MSILMLFSFWSSKGRTLMVQPANLQNRQKQAYQALGQKLGG